MIHDADIKAREKTATPQYYEAAKKDYLQAVPLSEVLINTKVEE